VLYQLSYGPTIPAHQPLNLFSNKGWLTGIEPATPGATDRCSNRLSYSHHTRLHCVQTATFILTAAKPLINACAVRSQCAVRSAGKSRDASAYYLALSMYSPVFGLTRTFSPVFTNSGTLIVTPFSSFAGFADAFFVAVFITADVSITSRTIEFGS
jgi:hypothetical protein